MTPIRPIFVFFCVLLTAAAVAVPVAQAADDPATLKRQLRDLESEIRADRERAARLEVEAVEQGRQLASLRAEMQAAARAVQSHEGAITRLEDERVLLHDEIAEKHTFLGDRRAQLGTTLAALQRIALRPKSALLVTPGDPNDIVRSALIIRTAIPRIEARAVSLRHDLDGLATLDVQLSGNKRDLEVAGTDLIDEQARLAGLVDRKNVLLGQTHAEQEAANARVEQLTRESRSLGELLEALMQHSEMRGAAPLPRPQGPTTAVPTATPGAPALRPQRSGSAVSAARGQLTPPAQGKLVIAFGDRNDFGAHARGVTWRTRPDATIVSPWDGRVAFAGRFRQFGRILIIDHGEGYHSLIAGLARVDARAGQWVLAGEPIGAAGDHRVGNDGQPGSDTGGRGPSSGPGNRAEGPTVYVEFRRNGQPINPLPWLAASLDRTNG